MKDPSQLRIDIERRWDRTWAIDVAAEATKATEVVAGRDPSARGLVPVVEPHDRTWPHAFPLGRVASTDLAADFGAFLGALGSLREWAASRPVELTWQERRVAGTSQQIPTHVTVASIEDAVAVLGRDWAEMLVLARRRAGVLSDLYPHALTPRTVAAVTRMSELDFDLLCRAADWFTARSGAGLTPRQVPIEGLHAKWLNSRHVLVAQLAGRESLELLPPHPARVHFTYLDPRHREGGGRLHDSATVGDVPALAYLPRVVIISENKDTAIHFPPIPGGVSVEGVGRGGGTASAFVWIREADCVIYWGDMDTDGLEILNEFRAAGIPARSVLMDVPSYEQWARYGTNLNPKGQALSWRPPAAVPHLSEAEKDLYLLLCDPAFLGVRRVEQERIPLSVAATAVLRVAAQGLAL